MKDSCLHNSHSRRRFLQWAIVVGGGLAVYPQLLGAQPQGARSMRPMAITKIGGAAVPFSRMGIHGLDFPELPREDAFRILERAVELEVTYFDTSANYDRAHEGERWLGEVFGNRREEVVISTGTHMREAVDAERILDDSLKRLRTDYIDVWKLEAIGTARDFERLTASGGALETARAALEDGRIRLLAIQGHQNPQALIPFIEQIEEIGAVQIPVNCIDPHFKSFVEDVLPVAREKGLAIIGSHDQALGSLRLAHKITRREAQLYTLSQPITTWLPQVRSVEELEECAFLARTYVPLSSAEIAELVERSAIYAGVAFEFYKR
ncbi:MAG: aldo/keto reductase [Candidatus Sumerlaeia bacterium]|nr:aldo/keto reductase [Candidatus Sumerlaeia bacterium]